MQGAGMLIGGHSHQHQPLAALPVRGITVRFEHVSGTFWESICNRNRLAVQLSLRQE